MSGWLCRPPLLEHLLMNTDWDVIATDSFRHQGKTDRISEVLAARPDQAHRVEVITHDLTAPFSTQMTRRIGHVDYLIAMAAESHVDRSSPTRCRSSATTSTSCCRRWNSRGC